MYLYPGLNLLSLSNCHNYLSESRNKTRSWSWGRDERRRKGWKSRAKRWDGVGRVGGCDGVSGSDGKMTAECIRRC